MLVIELAIETLEEDGLDLGSILIELGTLVSDQWSPFHLQVETIDNLHSGLSQYCSDTPTAPLICVVGHSDEEGLGLTDEGHDLSWADFGRTYLAQIEPKVLILTGCRAARWGPSRALFDTVPSLRAIFGSPVSLRKYQAVIGLQTILTHVVRHQPPSWLEVQISSYVATRALLFRWTRQEYEESRLAPWEAFFEGLSWTAFEAILQGLQEDEEFDLL